MAGDWIKVETCTPDKPEVYQLAELLNIDPDAVTGKLFRIWVWADQQTLDGNAVGVTKALLDRVTGVTGFANAMLEVGWLHKTDAGFQLPNFERHNGHTAKKRSLTSKRVKKHRTVDALKCNAVSVTKALPEKRREEINNIGGAERNPEYIIPGKLNDPECHAAAEKWFAFLASKGLDDKSPAGNEIALQEWWRQMARFGREDFLEAVSESIAAGRWNVTKSRVQAGPVKSSAKQSPDWIQARKGVSLYPDDWQKRQQFLGPEIFEALKRTGTAKVKAANDFELQSLGAIFESHLKDIREKVGAA